MQIFGGGKELADRKDLDELSGKNHIYVDDANKMIKSGFHYISNHNGRKDYPVQSWGNMIISNGENQRIVQIFTPDDGDNPWFRTFDGSAWHDWNQFATMANIANLLPSNIKQLGKIDVNNLPSGWCVVTDSTSLNLPTAVSGWCICFTLYINEKDRFQICVPYDKDGCNVFVRTCGGNQTQWAQWKKISYSA